MSNVYCRPVHLRTCPHFHFHTNLDSETDFKSSRWGIGLFLYQSMDAIDGKQARRTGMAGPLGEMFDHGIGTCHINFPV